MPLGAQSAGAVAGVVRETGPDGQLVIGARVTVDGGRYVATTDQRGVYRLRELSPGWHRVQAAAIGYRPVSRDSVLVRSGQTTALDFSLQPDPVGLDPIEVIAERVDSVLDPLAVQDQQRFTAEDLRRLPVSSVEEAIALSSGAVGESYRGGRLGQQAFILDGLGLKNQLDASTGSLGVRLPPDLLAEASLITNGFSARYGQAVSALVNLATRDGGDRWGGRAAYETDRPMGEAATSASTAWSWDADGPLPAGIRFLGVADLSARLDADPVNAPRPSSPRDPRHDGPRLLPHNSGEQADLAAKLTIPLGTRQTLRILGLHSADQRLLYDQAYKYDQRLAPVRRTTGNLAQRAPAAHLSRRRDITADLRVGLFRPRVHPRHAHARIADYRFGAFTGRVDRHPGRGHRPTQDTGARQRRDPRHDRAHLERPDSRGACPPSSSAGRHGETSPGTAIVRLRTRLDVSIPAGTSSDFHFGGEYSAQSVRTFQRVLGYLPAGDSVPATVEFRVHALGRVVLRRGAGTLEATWH